MPAGSVKKRGTDHWHVRVDLPRGADGRRRQKSVTVRGKKRDALARLDELRQEIRNGGFVDPSKLTVAGWLDKWLEQCRDRVSVLTWESYECVCRLHIVPGLGPLLLPRLSPIHIQELYQQLSRKDGVPGSLSAKTIRNIHGCLSGALATAVRLQLLPMNPAAAARPRRLVHREMRTLDGGEAAALIAAASNAPRMFLPILLAVTTGMRRGEIFGLKWTDVDFSGGAVAVRRSLTDTRTEGLRLKEPKTPGSVRSIAIPTSVVKALRKEKARQAEWRLLLGDEYDKKSDLVCANEDGSPVRLGAFSAAFPQFLKQHGLRRVRFHDLRHTHATLLIDAGTHLKVISARLGHSNIMTTANKYGHVLPPMERGAADAIETALERPKTVQFR